MKRRAFTLIEMSAVIAVGSVLMGVGVVMLIAMLKSEGSSRRHLEYCQNLNRLDEQFRSDAHAADSAQLISEGNALELALPAPNKTLVRYRCEKQEITREEIADEKTVRRESYPLPEEVIYAFDRLAEGPVVTVILRVEPKPAAGSKIRYPSTRIEAVLAKDRRFEKVEEVK